MSHIHQNAHTTKSWHAFPGNARHTPPRHFASESTPVKKKYGPDLTFTSEVKHFDQVRRLISKEMTGRWLGAMPVLDFFKQFLPSTNVPLPRLPRNLFKNVPVCGAENSCYKPFIEAIERWMPHLQAVDTGSKEDTKNKLKLKPDISVFDRVEGVAPPSRTDFSRMELWMEFKTTDGVAFQDPPDSESRQLWTEKGLFTPETVEGADIRGQLAHYAGAQHSLQFRQFSFSVLVEGDYSRFLRWDPAGAVVTARFNYRTEPELMAEFLWRFDHLSAGERGHDGSVQPANLSSDVAARVRRKLGIQRQPILLYRYELPGLIGKGYGYGPRPPTQNRSLVSRCTRSLPVVWIPTSSGIGPWDEEKLIYMKDTWRFLSNSKDLEVMAEHEIYEILHHHRTPNIPEHVAGGDLDGGKTRTQEFVDAPWLCVEPNVSPYQHYRLVHGIVGQALFKFECTKQLVTAVFDALKAHSHAYENAKILHRDISAGNIILTDDGRGLLIDWELAKNVEERKSRRPDRTGTWQFMSANLLQDPTKTHEFPDDLESFLHVLGWMTLRYVPAIDAYDAVDRRNDLTVFDEVTVRRGRSDRGGSSKSNALGAGQYPSRTYCPKIVTPLVDLLKELRKPFRSLYGTFTPTEEDRTRVQVPPDHSDHPLLLLWASVIQYDNDKKYLNSSAFFVDAMRAALERNDWPTDDKADEELRIALASGETDNRVRIQISQFQNSHTVWGNSQGPRGSKRAASPVPESSAKRRRGSPATSQSDLITSQSSATSS